MAILKETNMWFILIVVFAYMTPLEFSSDVEQVCSIDLFPRQLLELFGVNRRFLRKLLQAEPETCSTLCGEPESSLDVDFAFCISF